MPGCVLAAILSNVERYLLPTHTFLVATQSLCVRIPSEYCASENHRLLIYLSTPIRRSEGASAGVADDADSSLYITRLILVPVSTRFDNTWKVFETAVSLLENAAPTLLYDRDYPDYCRVPGSIAVESLHHVSEQGDGVIPIIEMASIPLSAVQQLLPMR